MHSHLTVSQTTTTTTTTDNKQMMEKLGKKRSEKHDSEVTLKWGTPDFLSTEAQKTNVHKRKSSFLQWELLNDFSQV